MFAKIFTQIFDSSIAEDYRVRLVFEDLLKLCDINGVVDMTHQAIARRTNVPVEIVRHGIAELEKPDPQSRSADHEGRRILRLDDHRDWGWSIVNYHVYRRIESEEQRREKTRLRVQKYRDKARSPVTPCNAGNGMQMEMERKYDKASGPTKATKPLTDAQKALAHRVESLLGDEWRNDSGKWINRIKSNPSKCIRVFDDLNHAIKTSEITGTPASYAEHRWKEFR